MFYLWQVQIIC